MSDTPTIAVVGSGPIGSAYARVLLEVAPARARDHVRGGTAGHRAPGRERAQHRRPRREGARPRTVAGAAGRRLPRVPRHPGRRGRRGHVHRAPGHAPARLRRRGLRARADLPGRGRGDQRRWPGRALDVRDPAPPRSARSSTSSTTTSGKTSSRPPRDCCTCRAPPSPTPRSAAAIRTLLDGEFAAELPEGYGVGTLPVAGDPQPDGSMRWAGADVVLGPLIEPGTAVAARFELRDLTLVRRDRARRRAA